MAANMRVPLMLWIVMATLATATGGNPTPCVVKGQLYTGLKWYGYLLQKTFHSDNARIEFQISYPVRECCANLLIYYDDQIKEISKDMTCKQREAVLPVDNNQRIPLNTTGGCELWTEGTEPMYLCTGERKFVSNGPRTWYFALSRCSGNSTKELSMNYFFNVTGYYGACEDDPLTKTLEAKVTTEPDVSVVVALGVVCGITTIVAIVFIILFIWGRKFRNTKKGGSVTSSQATMTQDIFYVNPSLSDREHSDSQYSHSQSSGSENYYEVIPDRRSYESINTQLALQGHNIRGLSLHASHLKDHRNSANIPAYILEDYPPPPYQPPPGHALHGTLPNGLHHRQSSAHALLNPSGHYASRQGIAMPNGTHLIPNGRAFQTVIGAHALYRPTPQRPAQTAQLREATVEQEQQGQKSNTPPSRNSNIPAHVDDVQVAINNRHSGSPTTMTSLLRAEPSAPQNTVLQVPNSQVSSGPGNSSFSRQLTNSIANAQNIQLQTYGQSSNQPSGSNESVPNGRPNQVPNGNVAKLLHDAYRIQQFETTA